MLGHLHYADSGQQAQEKRIKRDTLQEIVRFFEAGHCALSELIADDLFFMVASNLFRSLPPSKAWHGDRFDPEVTTLDPAWSHLEVSTAVFSRALSTLPCAALTSQARARRSFLRLQRLLSL